MVGLNAGCPLITLGQAQANSGPWAKYVPNFFFFGFRGGSAGKESACNVGDLGSIPGLGTSLGEGKGYPLQDSGLENSMNRKAHGITELDTAERL